MFDIIIATFLFVALALGFLVMAHNTRFKNINTALKFNITAASIMHFPLIALTLYAGWVFTPLLLTINFVSGVYLKSWAAKAKADTHWGSL